MFVVLALNNDKKYFKKKGRERHLPDTSVDIAGAEKT
jgi:hypothetical protein